MADVTMAGTRRVCNPHPWKENRKTRQAPHSETSPNLHGPLSTRHSYSHTSNGGYRRDKPRTMHQNGPEKGPGARDPRERGLGKGRLPVYQVGLTGGIASGKSTVSSMLAEKGAVIIDADLVAREVVEPGTIGLEKIVEKFGKEVLLSDGTLDRPALADIVFQDAEANMALRAITYPEIGRTIAEGVQANLDTDNIVILDAAMLVESGWQGLGTLIVVAAAAEVQIERMTRDREMTEKEATARLSSQAPLSEKLAKADIVIWNNNDLDILRQRVDEVWEELQQIATQQDATT